MTSGADLSFTRFSTRDLPARERVPYWREKCRVADIELQSDRPFEADASLLALPELRVGWCHSASPARWNRTAELVKDGDDDFALMMPLDAAMMRSQLGCDLEAQAGDGFGILHAEPSNVRFGEHTQHVVLMVPRIALVSFVPDLEDTCTRLVPRGTEALRLLRAYIANLREYADIADPTLCKVIATHIYDLMALAIGATRDGRQIAMARGVRAARMRAIKSDFAANPSLGLAAIAARQGVTPRYVQRLFEERDQSFTDYAMEQRLVGAYRMLRDDQFRHLTIAAIAYRAGFGDLSHFNRNFKRRFGTTPTELRRGA